MSHHLRLSLSLSLKVCCIVFTVGRQRLSASADKVSLNCRYSRPVVSPVVTRISTTMMLASTRTCPLIYGHRCGLQCPLTPPKPLPVQDSLPPSLPPGSCLGRVAQNSFTGPFFPLEGSDTATLLSSPSSLPLMLTAAASSQRVSQRFPAFAPSQPSYSTQGSISTGLLFSLPRNRVDSRL